MKEQTRKVKRKRFSFKRLVILLLFLYLFLYMGYYLINQNIKRIIIKGNSIVSDLIIIKSAGIEDYPSLFKINNKKMKNEILKNNLIDSVDISKNINGTIIIEVVENKILFINKSNNTYVLSNNKEIENNNDYLGIPILVNYVPSDIYEKLILKMSVLSYSSTSLISEIEYSPSKNDKGDIVDNDIFILRMNDGNKVIMDVNNFKVINYYGEMYSNLDKTGILHCDMSSDEQCFFEDEVITELGEKSDE